MSCLKKYCLDPSADAYYTSLNHSKEGKKGSPKRKQAEASPLPLQNRSKKRKTGDLRQTSQSKTKQPEITSSVRKNGKSSGDNLFLKKGQKKGTSKKQKKYY